MGADLVVGANIIVEVTHSRTNIPRLNWVLSHIKAEPVTEQAARAAAELLKGAGLHGHRYAIDATVAEVALRQPKPVALLTSDSDDMTKLCGTRSSPAPKRQRPRSDDPVLIYVQSESGVTARAPPEALVLEPVQGGSPVLGPRGGSHRSGHCVLRVTPVRGEPQARMATCG